MDLTPLMLFAATNNLSEVSFVAPYKLIGLLALSVDKATTFFIFSHIAMKLFYFLI